jgi:pimeloyl-ACP methyl ester carboxylesterase
MLDAELIRLRANGLDFAAYTAGEGPLVLCLHGFPDTPWTFHAQMPALVNAGLRVVVPYMRGYAPTQIPEPANAQAAALGRDTLGLVEALGEDAAIVVGHDFGGAAALMAALIEPERVAKLVTLATPYGPRLLQAMLFNDYAQQRRFWYQYFFLMPMAQAMLPSNEYDFIRRLCQDWSPGWRMPEQALEHTIDTIAKPGVLAAALEYYHAMYEPDHQDPALMDDQGRFGAMPVTVPSLHVHGVTDGCMGAELCDGMEAMFSGGLEKVILEGCQPGHLGFRSGVIGAYSWLCAASSSLASLRTRSCASIRLTSS